MNGQTRPFSVGVIGGTGYVGQRFLTLLEDHPWFSVRRIAASSRSAGKTLAEATEGRWKMETPMPESLRDMRVDDLMDLEPFCADVDFVFCAVDMKKEDIRSMEEDIARLETPVISNNSAHRWTPDVPVMVPELNADHAVLIEAQRRRLGIRNGFIAAKPNCSIQSYVPALHPLRAFGPSVLMVSTCQAISGAGKTFQDWPEMERNLIPFIGGEEEKSEQEPLRIWGTLSADAAGVDLAGSPAISANCYRVAVAEGHTAAVAVRFDRKPSREEILSRWATFEGIPQVAGLPSAPKPFLRYFEENTRPQPVLDRDMGKGMGIAIGRLREDPVLDWKFTCLSHNTIRGAAGGAILTAELLVHLGYLVRK